MTKVVDIQVVYWIEVENQKLEIRVQIPVGFVTFTYTQINKGMNVFHYYLKYFIEV